MSTRDNEFHGKKPGLIQIFGIYCEIGARYGCGCDLNWFERRICHMICKDSATINLPHVAKHRGHVIIFISESTLYQKFELRREKYQNHNIFYSGNY